MLIACYTANYINIAGNNGMNSNLHDLVIEALEAAKEQGLSQKDLTEISSLDQVTLSRLKKAEDAKFSTLEELGRSVGKKLVWVDSNEEEIPELLRKGKLLW